MYYDLNIPWPQARTRAEEGKHKTQGGKKGGGSAGGSNVATTSATTLQDPLESLTEAQRESMRLMTLDLADCELKLATRSSFGARVGHCNSNYPFLCTVGYSTIAFNSIVQTRFDGTKNANPFQPHPSGLPRPPFPELDPRCGAASDFKGKTALRTLAQPLVTQLSRMTLVMSDETMGKHGHGLVRHLRNLPFSHSLFLNLTLHGFIAQTSAHTNALLSYDLLAVRPTTEASFSAACLSLSELKPQSIDIISIDLAASARLPFFLKRSTVGAALSNGAVFEVCYSPAVSASTGDQQGQQDLLKARRNVISATRDILRVTNGRGVIFSSGAADIMGLRGPYDVINLASIFGLNAAAAKDAISSTCRALLLRAETRRTFRGVVADPVVGPSLHAAAPSALQQTISSDPDPGADMVGITESTSAGKKRKGPPSQDGENLADNDESALSHKGDNSNGGRLSRTEVNKGLSKKQKKKKRLSS